jgi:hypothetical protein
MWTVWQVHQRMHISERKIYLMIRRGEMISSKVAGKRLVQEREIQRLFTNGLERPEIKPRKRAARMTHGAVGRAIRGLGPIR